MIINEKSNPRTTYYETLSERQLLVYLSKLFLPEAKIMAGEERVGGLVEIPPKSNPLRPFAN